MGARGPPEDYEPPSRRQLAQATLTAVVVAGVVLVVAVLPAEYAIDPTGLGDALGFKQVAETDGGDPATGTGSTSRNLTRYRFGWTANRSDVTEASGYLAEGESTTATATVDADRVGRVVANLSWTDDNATAGESTEPDLFEIRLVGPNGSTTPWRLGRNGDDGTGTVEAVADVRPRPPVVTVDAADRSEADRRLADRVPVDGHGTGSWTIEIQMVEAGDHESQGQTLPADVDEGEDWSLDVDVATYRPVIRSAQPIRQDRVTFDVEPGEGVEWKVRAAGGDEIAYGWQVQGPALYYDLHGEPASDRSAFRSYATGSAAGDVGTFETLFRGTHGWYFENRGEATASVALTVKGTYEVVGFL